MAPRISGGAHSALYIGTIIDSEPTPIPTAGQLLRVHYHHIRQLTRDETTCKDRVLTGTGDRRGLDDNTKDEDSGVDQDSVLAREDLCKETGVQRSQPCTQLKDRHQPAHLRRVLGVVAHVFAKGVHHQDTSEDTLVVAVEETVAGQ